MSLVTALALVLVCAGPEPSASDKPLIKAANALRIVDIEQEIKELESSLNSTKDLSKIEKKQLVAKITPLKIELKQRKTNGNVKPPPITQPYRQGQVGKLNAWTAWARQILGPEEVIAELIFVGPPIYTSETGRQGERPTAHANNAHVFVLIRGMPTASLTEDGLFDLPTILVVGDNHTYETADGGSKTVRVFSPFKLDEAPANMPGNEYPIITGTWLESPTIPLTITQKGNEFKALCTYHHDEHGEIRWQMTGTVSKEGEIKGRLIHTKAPKTFGNQTRTGVVSSDGTTIKGHAAFDGGGGRDFEWMLEKPTGR